MADLSEAPTVLVDVSGLTLDDVATAPADSALARALRRIFDGIDRGQGAVAGWQSAI